MAQNTENFSNQTSRLRTFKNNWVYTKKPNAQELSEEGFIHSGSGNSVECYACGVVIKDWKENDNPRDRHIEAVSYCPLLTDDPELVPLPEAYTSPRRQQTSSLTSLCQRGTAGSFRPRRPRSPVPEKYNSEAERIKSFDSVSWRSDLKAQPANLTSAGFYYTGSGDLVKCGFCGGRLKKWQPHHIPLEEHRRNFPDCLFLREEHLQQAAAASTEHEVDEEVEHAKAVLLRLGYRKKAVKKAEKQLNEKNEPVTLTSLRPLTKKFDEDIFFKSDRHSDSSSDESDALSQEDEQFRTMQNELRALQQEKEELQNQITCKICLTNSVNTLFLTCRHMITCKECGDRVRDCPICRQLILGTVDVFMT